MNYNMPPGQIMLLLQIHCFVYQDQVTVLNGSPAAKKFLVRLLREELITPCNRSQPVGELPRQRHGFMTTSRGQALIEKWGNVELPVLVETWT